MQSNAYGSATKASLTSWPPTASTSQAFLPRPKGLSNSPPVSLLQSDAVAAAPLHLALVEPEIPPNTGNVARLCAATGCALHLVEPLGFSIGDRELKRAGLDYWSHVALVVHPSLDAFLDATATQRRWFFSTRGSHAYAQAPFSLGDVLVFGK